MIEVTNLSKSFTMHNQGGAVIPVIAGEAYRSHAANVWGWLANRGRANPPIYGDYLAAGGSIKVGDVVTAEPREILALRRAALGYVSQFLRVVARVPTLEVVAEPRLRLGVSPDQARDHAVALLTRLNIPARLWGLSPTPFSGGGQPRVNIARGFAPSYPALLLDEPTASLDATIREVVLALIEEAKARGAAIIGLFHDEPAPARVCDRLVDVTGFTPSV